MQLSPKHSTLLVFLSSAMLRSGSGMTSTTEVRAISMEGCSHPVLHEVFSFERYFFDGQDPSVDSVQTDSVLTNFALVGVFLGLFLHFSFFLAFEFSLIAFLQAFFRQAAVTHADSFTAFLVLHVTGLHLGVFLRIILKSSSMQ